MYQPPDATSRKIISLKKRTVPRREIFHFARPISSDQMFYPTESAVIHWIVGKNMLVCHKWNRQAAVGGGCSTECTESNGKLLQIFSLVGGDWRPHYCGFITAAGVVLCRINTQHNCQARLCCRPTWGMRLNQACIEILHRSHIWFRCFCEIWINKEDEGERII